MLIARKCNYHTHASERRMAFLNATRGASLALCVAFLPEAQYLWTVMWCFWIA